MFSRYYQSELSYLRELGREFAEANPSLAGMFTDPSGDPDVERLLEGFAFLTARVRERTDDAVPEMVEGLADLLVPQYLRSRPASSIVEFTPHSSAVRARCVLPIGTEVGSKPKLGTSCVFRTTSPVDLLPLSVESLEHVEPRAGESELRLGLRTSEEGRLAVFTSSPLRLHVHGAYPFAATLHLWFERHLVSTFVRDRRGRETRLPDRAVRIADLGAGHSLVPFDARAPRGMDRVVDYLTLPAKMLFLDVFGLERVPAIDTTEDFELVFRFEGAPPLPDRIDREALRLHCAPVVNLFEGTAEPIRRDPRIHEHLVRVAGVDPAHAEVFDIRDVLGLSGSYGATPKVRYPRFFDFEHLEKDKGSFSIRRANSPVDTGLDTYLAIQGSSLSGGDRKDETLSLDLVCTNRSLPAELGVGDICVPTPRSPTLARFRNITRVTPPVRPPLGKDLHWRLVSHLGLSRRSLLDPRVLAAELALYDFQADGDLSRANAQRISAIRDVKSRTTTKILDRAPLRGLEIEVELDESKMAGVGDANLFGRALDAVFSSAAPVGSFAALVVRLHPSGKELKWQPNLGLTPQL